MIDVATFGEAMASLRSAGPLTVPGTLTARIAGAESTVAIGLARLGHEVRWVYEGRRLLRVHRRRPRGTADPR
jgi:hypothetical protein